MQISFNDTGAQVLMVNVDFAAHPCIAKADQKWRERSEDEVTECVFGSNLSQLGFKRGQIGLLELLYEQLRYWITAYDRR